MLFDTSLKLDLRIGRLVFCLFFIFAFEIITVHGAFRPRPAGFLPLVSVR